MNLPVKSIHYTNGDLKAETLLSLGVIEHWDDDEEEIAAAKEAGIKANFVPGDEQIRRDNVVNVGKQASGGWC